MARSERSAGARGNSNKRKILKRNSQVLELGVELGEREPLGAPLGTPLGADEPLGAPLRISLGACVIVGEYVGIGGQVATGLPHGFIQAGPAHDGSSGSSGDPPALPALDLSLSLGCCWGGDWFQGTCLSTGGLPRFACLSTGCCGRGFVFFSTGRAGCIGCLFGGVLH